MGAAISLQLEIARAAQERAVKLVREQLSGFDSEKIERDPCARRARNEVESWERLQARFTDSKGLGCWKIGIDSLFREMSVAKT
ncbi:MAG: hypothetical protein DME59_03045 [Verrucomicrobia bacterium]|nr:MAG: hypothetical protein DME59_03045 [Verrucomicrobiota bacterium]PYL70545.1 MAG: hypothetical protein DMF26_21650 [Verrucomicrobiota bacterium]